MTIEEPTIQKLSVMGKMALCRELGVANSIRFLQGYSTGTGNYTKERTHIYADKTLDAILGEIKMKG